MGARRTPLRAVKTKGKKTKKVSREWNKPKANTTLTKKKGNKICPAGIAWAKRTFDTYPSAYANMVRIPSGSFSMGGDAGLMDGGSESHQTA